MARRVHDTRAALARQASAWKPRQGSTYGPQCGLDAGGAQLGAKGRRAPGALGAQLRHCEEEDALLEGAAPRGRHPAAEVITLARALPP
jgi:hypothetical protein